VSEYSLGVAPVAVYSDNEALERAYYSRRNAPPGTSSDTLAHMTATPDIASPRDGEFFPPVHSSMLQNTIDSTRCKLSPFSPSLPLLLTGNFTPHITVADMGLGLPAPILLARGSRSIRAIQVEDCSVLFCAVLYYAVSCCAVLHGAVLQCTVQHCIEVYCILLLWTTALICTTLHVMSYVVFALSAYLSMTHRCHDRALSFSASSK
jgi:hypothetical protein